MTPAAAAPPLELRAHLPRQLYPRHVAVALDVPPSRARWLLTGGGIDSVQPGHGRHRWCSPEALIAYAIDARYPIDWYAVADLEHE